MITYVPRIWPKTPPSVVQPMTRGRMGMRRNRIITVAMVIPMDWIISPKVRASLVGMCSSLVKTGKATAAPPWGVEPATNEPSTIVREMGQ